MLEKSLVNPKEVVPGTTMAYVGLKNPTQRADLIAYLETIGPALPYRLFIANRNYSLLVAAAMGADAHPWHRLRGGDAVVCPGVQPGGLPCLCAERHRAMPA